MGDEGLIEASTRLRKFRRSMSRNETRERPNNLRVGGVPFSQVSQHHFGTFEVPISDQGLCHSNKLGRRGRRRKRRRFVLGQ
jgi:hypothetical protein